MLKLIAAIAENGVIGRGLELPWHLPMDMGWFKTQTGKKPVVMGRKTFQSLPDGFRPLPNRENIVVTRSDFPWDPDDDRVRIVRSPLVVREWAKTEDFFIIGGAEVYKTMLPYVDEMYITRVHGRPDGDVFFPEWNLNDWRRVFQQHNDPQGHTFRFSWEIYTRRHAQIHRSHPFIEMTNCRTDKQRGVMEQILEADHCPFCPEHLDRWHKPVILYDGQHWLVTYNQWQYPNTELHVLIIAKEHVESSSDLPDGAGEELFAITRWVEEKFNVQGGALTMRFGEPTLTGATVRHLHAQIVVPHPKAIGPVLVYVGGSKKSV